MTYFLLLWVVIVVAAVAVYFKPEYAARLIRYLSTQIWKSLRPIIFGRMSKTDEESWGNMMSRSPTNEDIHKWWDDKYLRDKKLHRDDHR